MTRVQPIDSYDGFIASLRNFHAWLGDTVPGAMDLDFLCERGGKFLTVEAKPWRRGVVVKYGQDLALRRLAQQENFTVFLLGECEREDRVWVADYAEVRPRHRPRPGRLVIYPPKEFECMTRDEFRTVVEGWWADAGQ